MDFSPILFAVDFSSVVIGLLAVFSALALVLVALKGARFVVRSLRIGIDQGGSFDIANHPLVDSWFWNEVKSGNFKQAREEWRLGSQDFAYFKSLPRNSRGEAIDPRY